jgi:hypothetical protein
MTSASSSNRHRHHSQGFFTSYFYKKHVETTAFIAIPFIIYLLMRITNPNLYAVLAGAIAVSSLTIARYFQYKAVFFISVVAILAMLMSEIWNWTDIYLIPILSGNIVSNLPLFRQEILEGIVLVFFIILYKWQLNRMKMKITYLWYSSKTYKSFIKILLFFFIFLSLFWVTGFLAHFYFSGQPYDKNEVSKGAAIAALVLTAIPAVLTMIKPRSDRKMRPRTRHRHRHHSSSGDTE